MIYNDNNGFMTLFIVFFLLIVLTIIYFICSKTQENFCSLCSTNIDWYVGKEGYKKLCPKGQQTSFLDTRTYEGFKNNKEGILNYPPEQNFMKQQIEECKKLGYKPAYNPHLCSTGKGINRQYDYYKNCMCMDNDFNCVKCMDKPKKVSVM